ncbi:hypothetical protein JCM9279_001521 [Rhodotorula babjevae]
MTLMDPSQGTEMERLWALLSELSAQLSHNRQQTEELHRRAEELKAQAVHTQTGYTLRRFNLDVSQEDFESELEKLNVSLVMENQALQQENRQLSSLLKDYESTLEAVMGKFRAHAHATQQHHLDLTRHYESLLLNMPVSIPPPADMPQDPTNAEAPPIDPLHLQLSLSHLASLVRKALRALQGEDPDDSTSPLLLPMGIGQAAEALSRAFPGPGSAGDLDSAQLGGPPSPTSSIASFSSLASSAQHAPPSAHGGDAAEGGASSSSPDLDRLLASHHPSTARSRTLESEGGYISRTATSSPHYVPTTSTSSLVASPPLPGQPAVARDEMALRGLGPLDEPLQREIELEALRKENDELKRLLGIADEVEHEARAREERDRAADADRRQRRRDKDAADAAAGGGGTEVDEDEERLRREELERERQREALAEELLRAAEREDEEKAVKERRAAAAAEGKGGAAGGASAAAAPAVEVDAATKASTSAVDDEELQI